MWRTSAPRTIWRYTPSAAAPASARTGPEAAGLPADGPGGARRQASQTRTEKKAIEVARWPEETTSGSFQTTVSAPREAWKSTRPRATRAPTRTAVSFRRRQTVTASATVSTETARATSRWPCSNRTPPSMAGKNWP